MATLRDNIIILRSQEIEEVRYIPERFRGIADLIGEELFHKAVKQFIGSVNVFIFN